MPTPTVDVMSLESRERESNSRVFSPKGASTVGAPPRLNFVRANKNSVNCTLRGGLIERVPHVNATSVARASEEVRMHGKRYDLLRETNTNWSPQVDHESEIKTTSMPQPNGNLSSVTGEQVDSLIKQMFASQRPTTTNLRMSDMQSRMASGALDKHRRIREDDQQVRSSPHVESPRKDQASEQILKKPGSMAAPMLHGNSFRYGSSHVPPLALDLAHLQTDQTMMKLEDSPIRQLAPSIHIENVIGNVNIVAPPMDLPSRYSQPSQPRRSTEVSGYGLFNRVQPVQTNCVITEQYMMQ